MRFDSLCRISFAALLFISAGCKEPKAAAAAPKAVAGKPTPKATPPVPTEEDLRYVHDVLTLGDVIARLQAGTPREKVLADVRQRHIATAIVEANDLELAANGAGRELISAMHDPRNVLTPLQEGLYMEMLTARMAKAASAKAAGLQPASAKRVATH